MTNPEQTLRERLAEAVGDSVVGYTETALQHETLKDKTTDAVLKAVREWLESEAIIEVAIQSLPALSYADQEMKKLVRKDITEAWKRFTEAIAQSPGDSP